MGREFSGPTFRAKPIIVSFRDFTTSVVHTKKIRITNVSYGPATFKVAISVF